MFVGRKGSGCRGAKPDSEISGVSQEELSPGPRGPVSRRGAC